MLVMSLGQNLMCVWGGEGGSSLRLKFDKGLIYLCVIALALFSIMSHNYPVISFLCVQKGILINGNCYLNKKVMDISFA